MSDTREALTVVANVVERAGGNSTDLHSAAPPAIGYYKILGEWLPMRVGKRCLTCGAEKYRRTIDRALALGLSELAIANMLPEKVSSRGKEVTLTPRNIRDHGKKHLPAEVSARIRALEEGAQELGLSTDTFEGSIATHIGLNNLVLQQTVEGLLRGTIRPSVSDGLKAVQNKIALDQMGDASLEAERVSALMQKLGECIEELAYSVEDGKIEPTHQDMIYAFGVMVKNKPGLLELMQPKQPEPPSFEEDDSEEG